MRYIDANIFVRYLTGDDVVKASACLALFQRLARDEEQATTSEAVITEVVYVLKSRALYGLAADEIQQRLQPLVLMRGLRLRDRRTIVRALDVFTSHPTIDFEDALSVAHMEREGIAELYSYDRDFDRIADVTRVEPS